MRKNSVCAKPVREQSRILLICLKQRFDVGRRGNELLAWAVELRPNSVRNGHIGPLGLGKGET